MNKIAIRRGRALGAAAAAASMVALGAPSAASASTTAAPAQASSTLIGTVVRAVLGNAGPAALTSG